jgi:hypothetical protein
MRIFSVLAVVAVLVCGSALAAETAVPATAFFPVFPLNAPPDSKPQMVPLAASMPLDEVHFGVTQAIVVIHDETRDAPAALATLTALAGAQNSSTIVLAPQFLLPSDIMRFTDYLPEKGKDFAAWQIFGWISGDDSMPVTGRKSVSSFTVVDLLLMYLSDREAFPDMRAIVVAGYGAGGNFVQRYAAFSQAYEPVMKSKIDLRFLVAGAKSYLYQTPSRPAKKRFAPGDAAACPGFNAYPFGLEQLNPYARLSGGNAAKIDYATRTVIYLNAGATNAPMDTDCATLAQGPTSAVRAENYHRYLVFLYGDLVERTQTFFKVEGPAYDAVALYGSSCGMSVLFGEGYCPSLRVGMQ